MIEAVGGALRRLLQILTPLRTAAASRRQMRAVLDTVGWDLDRLTSAPAEALIDGVIALAADLEAVQAVVIDPPADLAAAGAALETAASLMEHVHDLVEFVDDVSGRPELERFVIELIEVLTLLYLRTTRPLAYQLLVLTGVIERAEAIGVEAALVVDGRALRKPRFADRIRLGRVPTLLTDPMAALRAEYFPAGLATEASARAAAAKLFPRLAELAGRCGLEAQYGVKLAYGYDFGDAADTVDRMLAVRHYVDGTPLALGAILAIVSEERGAGRAGLMVSPWGSGTLSETVGGWTLTTTLSAGIDAVVIRADGIEVQGPGESTVELAFTATRAAAPPAAGALFAPGQVRIAAAIGRDHGETTARVELSLEGATLVIGSSAQGDGFLARLAPGGQTTATFDAALTWERGRGLRFAGNAALEARFAVDRDARGFRLEAVRLGVRPAGQTVRIEVGADVRLAIGPVAVSAQNIGLAAVIDLAAERGNLGVVDGRLAARWPDAIGLAIDAGAVRGGGFIAARGGGRYEGALALDAYGVALSAYGVLDTAGPGYSLAAVVSAEFSPIQLGLGFKLEGVGGLIGIHRRVDTDALRAALRGPGIRDIFFAADPVGQAARLTGDLARYFPAAPGRYVFGPAVKIGWGTPTIVEGVLAILLEVPSPVRVVLLGSVSAALPTKEAPIILLNVDVVGEVDFGRKTVAIDASLRDSQVAGFAITGDLALRMGWGDPPSFALAIGGFHSQFRPPPGFPELRRVRIPIGAGDNPRLDIQGFLALTSNTAQVGAQIDLYAAAGPLNVVGNLGFEALIQFVPFSFQVDLWAGVALRRGTRVLAGVHLEGTLRGPSPWHFAGEACLSLWFIDLCVSFDATFGQAQAVELPERDIWTPLQAALEDVRSWSTTMPAATARAVTTATPVGGAATRIDPAAALSVRQKVAPLNREIERFAQVAPSGDTRFDVHSARLGTRELGLSELTMVNDWFAAAQFEAMTDAERLSRPGYEQMVGGVTLAGDEVTIGAALTKTLAYETFLFPDPQPLPTLYVSTRDVQLDGVAMSANASAPLRAGPGRAFAPPRGTPPLMILEEEAFVIATTADLAPRLDLALAGGRGATELALKAYLAANPSARGTLQVVPRFEVEDQL